MKLRYFVYCFLAIGCSAKSDTFECFSGTGKRLKKVSAGKNSPSAYCTADIFTINDKPSFIKYSFTNEDVDKSYRIPGCVPVQKDGIDGFTCHCQHSLCNTEENVQEWLAEFGIRQNRHAHGSLRAMRRSGRFKRDGLIDVSHQTTEQTIMSILVTVIIGMLPILAICCSLASCALCAFGTYKFVQYERRRPAVIEQVMVGTPGLVVAAEGEVAQGAQPMGAEPNANGAEPCAQPVEPSPRQYKSKSKASKSKNRKKSFSMNKWVRGQKKLVK